MDEDHIISKGGWQWYQKKKIFCKKALWHLWDRKHMVALSFLLWKSTSIGWIWYVKKKERFGWIVKTIVNNVLCRMDESCIKSPQGWWKWFKENVPKGVCSPSREQKKYSMYGFLHSNYLSWIPKVQEDTTVMS